MRVNEVRVKGAVRNPARAGCDQADKGTAGPQVPPFLAGKVQWGIVTGTPLSHNGGDG